jgi:hypothetical protein
MDMQFKGIDARYISGRDATVDEKLLWVMKIL